LILVDGKLCDVTGQKSKFYYEILRNKKFVKPYMQKVWYRQTKLEMCLYDKTWQKVYCIKIKKVFSRKLAEFNFKMLNGTLPCGMHLNKWKKEIPANCTVCINEIENIKHMIFDCKNVRNVWKALGQCFNIQIAWKTIVIGYYEHLNETMSDINIICNIIAYSIFKENNKCKWNETIYRKCNVQKTITKDLENIHKIQLYMKKSVLKTKKIEDIIYCITTTN